jgi:uncharacterized membrane protein
VEVFVIGITAPANEAAWVKLKKQPHSMEISRIGAAYPPPKRDNFEESFILADPAMSLATVADHLRQMIRREMSVLTEKIVTRARFRRNKNTPTGFTNRRFVAP